MKPVLTVADLDEARGRERAFVFLFVNWSGPAHTSKATVRRLVDCWQQEAPDRPAPCYLVDLSEQTGPIWDAVDHWLTANDRPAGPLMFGGAGPLLWVHCGTVVAHVPGALHKSVETLLAVTRAIFGTDSEATSPDPTAGASARQPGPIWPDDELTRQWLEGIAEARRRADREPAPWEEMGAAEPEAPSEGGAGPLL